MQIANGLAAAHAKGITHRDLKPENVFLTSDGRAKILDFGLARLDASRDHNGMEATIASPAAAPLTSRGIVMGTVGYMAPEQVRGAAVDHRADIFALGIVLLEMLTGKRPFVKDSTVETMNAILHEDPLDARGVGAALRQVLADVVRRCIEKRPEERYQSAGDLAFHLRLLAQSSSGSGSMATSAPMRATKPVSRWWLAAIAALGGVFAGGAIARAVWSSAEPSSAAPVVFQMPMPVDVGVDLFTTTRAGSVTVSPDGHRIAFVGRRANGESHLYVRSLDALEATPVSGTEGAILPFWSPDGQRLAFCQGQKLRHVAVEGGGATDIADCFNPRTRGSWGADGTILFVPDYQGPLMRVSANGGEVEQVLAGGWANASFSFFSPVWLRDSKRFLVARFSYFEDVAEEGTYVGTIGSADVVRVTSGQTQEIAIDGGELYVRRGENLLVQSFDESSATVSGQVRTVASRVVAFAAEGGTLAYYARPHGLSQNQKVRWFGRDGTVLGDTIEGGTYRDLRVSPDGQSLAMIRTNARGLGQIWTYDLNRQIDAPAISGVGSFNPVWLPDGLSLIAGTGRTLVRARMGDPTPQPLFSEATGPAVPEDVSRDGKHLLYVPIEPGSARLMVRPLHEGSAARQVGPTTTRLGVTGVFSPDGRWIVYSVAEGPAPRLYATPFPALDSRIPVTVVTGVRPRWRGDGSELFFVTSTRGPTSLEERRLMALPVSWTPNGPEFGRAQPLFVAKGIAVASAASFDVSPDGQRFVFVADSEPDRSPLVVRVRRD